MTTCFICEKHLGNTQQPPGGYIYEDEHWKVCHFPAEQSVQGNWCWNRSGICSISLR